MVVTVLGKNSNFFVLQKNFFLKFEPNLIKQKQSILNKTTGGQTEKRKLFLKFQENLCLDNMTNRQ